MNDTAVKLIPSAYRLPWSRFERAEDWMKAEIVATKFAPDGIPTKWAVREMGAVLCKDELLFEHEPQPSSRDDDFLRRTRFESPEEAAECATIHFTKH